MTFDEEQQFLCPYCGQSNSLTPDASAGRRQEFVVDCEVCCAPIVVRLTLGSGGQVSVDARRENE